MLKTDNHHPQPSSASSSYIRPSGPGSDVVYTTWWDRVPAFWRTVAHFLPETVIKRLRKSQEQQASHLFLISPEVNTGIIWSYETKASINWSISRSGAWKWEQTASFLSLKTAINGIQVRVSCNRNKTAGLRIEQSDPEETFHVPITQRAFEFPHTAST